MPDKCCGMCSKFEPEARTKSYGDGYVRQHKESIAEIDRIRRARRKKGK